MSNNQAMNHDLIKQLELAIQVERGEVPRDEVQAKYKPGTGNDWVALEVRDNPHLWDFCLYEYRRKPKPRKVWVTFDKHGLPGTVYENRQLAIDKAQEDWAKGAPVEFVEVTNE